MPLSRSRSVPLVLGVIALLKRHLELQALHRVLETKQYVKTPIYRASHTDGHNKT